MAAITRGKQQRKQNEQEAVAAAKVQAVTRGRAARNEFEEKRSQAQAAADASNPMLKPTWANWRKSISNVLTEIVHELTALSEKPSSTTDGILSESRRDRAPVTLGKEQLVVEAPKVVEPPETQS